jgi:hypothetical protein
MQCPPEKLNPELPYKPNDRELMVDKRGFPHMFGERLDSGNVRMRLSDQGRTNIRAGGKHIDRDRIKKMSNKVVYASAPAGGGEHSSDKKGRKSRFQRGSR